MTGIVISILVFLLFLFDLVFGLIGIESLAPFRQASMVLDITFVVCSVLLGYLSWLTWKEQD